jgi:protein phosphatase
VICRDHDVAQRRFGASALGICYTRTGRRFFDVNDEPEVLERIATDVERAGLWDELSADWLCLDTELLPWSFKARELIADQYAAVGAAARAAMPAAVAALASAVERGVDAGELLRRYQERNDLTARYVDSYRRYARPANSIDDVRIAPFHILAGGHETYETRSHTWHMETLSRLCVADPTLFTATPYRVIDLESAESRAEGINWWLQLTEAGGEGMVVKPETFLAHGRQGIVQPALKCRGREYLRIIYGPEYTLQENIERLRSRSVGRKSALALTEFLLGLEGLGRFVEGEPSWRVAEASLGVLALESEPVDPRL